MRRSSGFHYGRLLAVKLAAAATVGAFPGSNDPFGAAFQNLPADANRADGRCLITGAATGQRTDPVGMYQQMAGMTYKALLDAGVPEPQARLGATNPDVQKAITAKMFPTYAPQNIGNTTGSFNPATGQFTPQYVAPEFKTVAPGDTGISYQPPLQGAAPGPLGGPVQIGAIAATSWRAGTSATGTPAARAGRARWNADARSRHVAAGKGSTDRSQVSS